LKPSDLATTLNTGIGMIVICDPADKEALIASFESTGETVYEIGRITAREDEAVKLLNMDTHWTA
jgi:phosphoribosylaminoimidazole (AIR) synthetase